MGDICTDDVVKAAGGGTDIGDDRLLIKVGDARHRLAPLSRRALELRFARRMHRSVLDEIHRVKVECAKRLLVETNHKIAAIADACSLSPGTRLDIIFQQFTGQHPSDFRREHHAVARQ